MIFTVFILFHSPQAILAAELRLSRIFSSRMVLQRDRPVPIWGWADPGEQITVTFAGQTKSAAAGPDGAWRVTLDALEASADPSALSIASERVNRTLNVDDVLVGDVWLCSGDFGVYYEMFKCANATEEISAASNPLLRLFKIHKKSSNQPLDDSDGEWRTCAPETVTDFSALAYFFGRTLQGELKVPIGLIDASYPYSYARGWMPASAFQTVPELSKPREMIESRDPTTPAGRAAFSDTLVQVEAWLPIAEQAFRDGQPIPAQPRLPAPLPADDSNYRSIGEFSLHYNAMIHPLVPYAMRGMVWSLGENGCLEVDKFRFHLAGLFQSWRQAWQQGDFPIYLELLPKMGEPAELSDIVDYYTLMREEQLKTLALVANTDAAVSFDVSDYMSDERNRQDAGERLARLALAHEYQKQITYSGPRYQSHRIDGDKIIVSFAHIGSGLIAGEKQGLAPVQELAGGTLGGFAVAGEDKQWHWAEALIDGDTVIVRSNQVSSPFAVRYAASANPANANLYNREGLPALPFRTDE